MRMLMLPFLLLLAASAAVASVDDGPVYELRTYTAAPGRLDDVLARFRDHTIALFNRHGMKSVAYWVPMDAKDGAGEKLVYLLQHPSRAAAARDWAAFRDDPEWQAVSKASEAHGKIVIHVESVFLSPTDFSPLK